MPLKKFNRLICFPYKGLIGLFVLLLGWNTSIYAQADSISVADMQENDVDVKDIVFGHINDAYEWHITKIGHKELTIPLPIIVHSSTSGWHAFLSSRLEENHGTYKGFSIGPKGTKYEGKIVEYNVDGEQIRPFDISITKVAMTLMIHTTLLIIIILFLVRW